MAASGGPQQQAGSSPAALQQLQEALVQLKHQVPGLHLKKSTAAQSPAAPFPITASAEVCAPPAAERYDVQSFQLQLRLGPGVLGGSGAAAGSSGTHAAGSSTGSTAGGTAAQSRAAAAAVQVAVLSPDLPRRLRDAMAAELHRLWAASNPGPGALNLALPWALAQQQFVHLLSLVPDCLEAYQSEDAWGSTVRRWAILNDTTTVQIDASVHPSSPPAKRPAGVAAAAAAVAAAGGRQAQQPARAAAGPATAAAQPASELPRSLQSEFDFLHKRYGMKMQPGNTADAAGTGGAASPASAAGAAAAQLAGLSLSQGKPTVAAAAAALSGLAFEVSLRPTDPAWDPAHPLLLCGSLQPGSYPAAGSLNLAVSPAQQPELSALQREVLGKLVQQEVAGACGRPGALRAVLRHLENHAGELWQASEDIAAEVARRRAAGSAGAAAAAQAGSICSSDLDDDGAYGGYGSSSDEGSSGSNLGSDSEDEGGPASPDGGGGHSDAVLPLHLELEGLELVDCDALELLRLNLQVTCTRCRAAGELSFATAAVALPSDARGGGKGGSGTLGAAGECANCHQPWAAEVAPKLLHERSNTLAHIRAEGCTPLDLLPSWLAGQCSRCSSSAAFRNVAVGRWNERACSSCHTPMRFQFSTALFVAHKPGGGRQQGTAGGSRQQQPGASRGRAAGGGGDDPYSALLIQPGSELPDRGTCKHYRHSYRWLRFPCCGKRFPCDLCHEEFTDHDLKWATRMTCGYCSTEQPVAGECKACGKKLAARAAAPTGRQTRFWEGGKGQRDPSKLHPNDPRRWKGRNKTSSRKSTRVGQAGKLEAAYFSHAAPARARIAARFAVFRLVLLIFTAVKALLAARQFGREALLLLGAASNVLPLLAAVHSPCSHWARLVRWGALGTDVLQAVIGVANHAHMAPSHAGAWPAAALVYLAYGSTALWLLCYAAFSPLPFHMLLLQQSLVAMVLLAGSGSMCVESAGLRSGYAALHALLQRVVQSVPAWNLPLLPGWPAIVSAFSLAPSSVQCPASSAAKLSTAASAAAAAGGADGVHLRSLVRLCIGYQLPVLLGSFALSTWLAYRAELRSRLAWLAHLRQSTIRGTATRDGGSDGGSGGSNGGSARPAAAPDATSAEAAALRQAVDFELIEPLPNDADYWLQLALPCMLCIGAMSLAII